MIDSGTVGSGSDWGMAIVLDPRELTQLETDNARLRARHGRRTRVIWVLCMSWLLSTSAAYWGRRFTVTKYLPHDPKYGRDDDGLTATLMAADPASRIVAVDPTLIPYGS